MKKSNDIINFLAEAGQLKRVKRSGWWVAGIKEPESVAEHCFRCAIIGYVLAKMDGADPYKVLLMSLFHDTQESRLNDAHKIVQRYVALSAAEKQVCKEQLDLLPELLRKELTVIRARYDAQDSKEAVIARDADILECILQAKEYMDFGFVQAKSFMSVGKKFLKSKSAKLLYKKICSWDYHSWWSHLKTFSR